MYKKLYKVRFGAKIDGVCAGLANYVGMDHTIMRLIWVIGTLFLQVPGVLAYIICSLIMPREPQYFDNNEFNQSNNYNGNQNNNYDGYNR